MRESVKSATRTLEILKLFSLEQRALNQKEIISKLGYPQSSATFLLKSMVETGFLSFDRTSRTYLPTPEFYKMAEWLGEMGYLHLFGDGIITELMDRLHADSEEVVALATQNDIYVQWHRMIVSKLPINLSVVEGDHRPLIVTSYGNILLSQQPEIQMERTLRLINSREPSPSYKVDINATMARLRKVRELGYCIMPNTYRPNLVSVAMLLPVKIAGKDVAIGIGCREDRIKQNGDHFLKLLRDSLAEYRDRLEFAFPPSGGSLRGLREAPPVFRPAA